MQTICCMRREGYVRIRAHDSCVQQMVWCGGVVVGCGDGRQRAGPDPGASGSRPRGSAAGKQLYAKYCRFCHGNTGAGDSTMAPKNMKPSNLTDTTWTRGSSEGEIFWVIQNGAPPEYHMKGLKGKISDTDTWNLVHYVRSLGGAK
jgi:mono/diheme cytochrome c family protein